MTRKEILDQAEICVNGKREQDYGSPEDNFTAIADFWNRYIIAAHANTVIMEHSKILNAKDVAMMMALLKIARIASGTGTDDCYVDLAGYAACAGEVASKKLSELHAE